MKRIRAWKFSQGGGALFVLLLMTPIYVRLVQCCPSWGRNNGEQWWAWPLFLGLLLMFTMLLWFLSFRPLIRQRSWVIPRTWYEACFGIVMVYSFFAAFVFVTGYTPSKYNSHPVPRITGLTYLYWAIVPFFVGVAAYVYDRFKR